MKHLIVGFALCALVTPVMAGALTFSENWESYTGGNPPGSPWYHDTDFADGPLITSGANAPQDTLSLRATDASYGGKNLGVQALVVNAGESVQGTDGSPLTLSFADKAQHYRFTDFFIELSMGDVHAPSFTTVALNDPIPVIGFGKPYIEAALNNETGAPYGAETGQQLSFFDGKQWQTPGLTLTVNPDLTVSATAGIAFTDSGTWETGTMTIGTSDVTLDTSKHSDATDIAYTLARQYLGAFDRITIYTRFGNITRSGTIQWTQIDALEVTGGNVIPEPVTVALLGLGCLFLRRRSA